MKWTVELSYPDKSERRPYDQPEVWEGTSLIGFAERLEDAVEASAENAAGAVGVLVEGVLRAADLRRAPSSRAHLSWDGEDGRHVVATLEEER